MGGNGTDARAAYDHFSSIATFDFSSPRGSSQAETVEQPCHRPAVPSATARRGDQSLGQLIRDLLDRQVAKLDQDRPQRLCISIGFALVLLRLLGIVELDAARLMSGPSSATMNGTL